MCENRLDHFLPHFPRPLLHTTHYALDVQERASRHHLLGHLLRLLLLDLLGAQPLQRVTLFLL